MKKNNFYFQSFWIFIFLLLIFPFVSSYSIPHGVFGQVFDNESNPQNGLNITLFLNCSDHRSQASTITKNQGSFLFDLGNFDSSWNLGEEVCVYSQECSGAGIEVAEGSAILTNKGVDFVGNLTVNVPKNIGYWEKINYPEGVFEPLCCKNESDIEITGKECFDESLVEIEDGIVSSKAYNCENPSQELEKGRLFKFCLDFIGIEANANSSLKCYINTSREILILNKTFSSHYIGEHTFEEYGCEGGENFNVSLCHVLSKDSPVYYDSDKGYLPWEVLNCSIYNSDDDLIFYNDSSYGDVLEKKIYVHNNTWTASYSDYESDVHRALKCFLLGFNNIYFDSTKDCTFQGDQQSSVARALNNKVEGNCNDGLDNDDNGLIDCEDPYCQAIYYRCGHPERSLDYEDLHPTVLFNPFSKPLPPFVPIIWSILFMLTLTLSLTILNKKKYFKLIVKSTSFLFLSLIFLALFSNFALAETSEDCVEIDIPDSNLESALRELDEIPNEGPIYDCNASEITGDLNLRRESIENITGLEYFVNVSILGLTHNAISNLTPLSDLINLENLDLSFNAISNLTPLSDLINLRTLYLVDNEISDLTPLSSLTNLENLYLNENYIDINSSCGDTDSWDIINNCIEDSECDVVYSPQSEAMFCEDDCDNDVDALLDCDDDDCECESEEVHYDYPLCDDSISLTYDGVTYDMPGNRGLCGPCPEFENYLWNSCSDLIDNDYDTPIDCNDSDCNAFLGQEDGSQNCEFDIELTCDDDFDNDADGLIDCLDEDCDGISDCEFETELTCDDDFDNDADGLIDYADPDCGLSLDFSIGESLPYWKYQEVTSTISINYTYKLRQTDHHQIKILGNADNYSYVFVYLANETDVYDFNFSSCSITGRDADKFTISDTEENYGIFLTKTSWNEDNTFSDFEIMLDCFNSSILLGDYTNNIRIEALRANNTDLIDVEYGEYLMNTSVIEDSSPAIHDIIIEPSNETYFVDIDYNETIWFLVNATDAYGISHCDFEFNSTFSAVFNDYDCKINASALEDGNYNLTVTVYNSYGFSSLRSILFEVNVKPISTFNSIASVDDDFDNYPFFKDDVKFDQLNLSADFRTADNGMFSPSCELFVDSSSTSISTTPIPIRANRATCDFEDINMVDLATSISLSNGKHFVQIKLIDEDGNFAFSNKRTIYWCNNSLTGECKYADFDGDGYTEGIIAEDSLGDSLYPWLDYDVYCDMCAENHTDYYAVNLGADSDNDGIDDVCDEELEADSCWSINHSDHAYTHFANISFARTIDSCHINYQIIPGGEWNVVEGNLVESPIDSGNWICNYTFNRTNVNFTEDGSDDDPVILPRFNMTTVFVSAVEETNITCQNTIPNHEPYFDTGVYLDSIETAISEDKFDIDLSCEFNVCDSDAYDSRTICNLDESDTEIENITINWYRNGIYNTTTHNLERTLNVEDYCNQNWTCVVNVTDHHNAFVEENNTVETCAENRPIIISDYGCVDLGNHSILVFSNFSDDSDPSDLDCNFNWSVIDTDAGISIIDSETPAIEGSDPYSCAYVLSYYGSWETATGHASLPIVPFNISLNVTVSDEETSFYENFTCQIMNHKINITEVNITPVDANLTDDLTCNWNAIDSDLISSEHDEIDYSSVEYRWFEDSTEIPVYSQNLGSGNTSFGHCYKCQVYIEDDDSDHVSENFTYDIMNSSEVCVSDNEFPEVHLMSPHGEYPLPYPPGNPPHYFFTEDGNYDLTCNATDSSGIDYLWFIVNETSSLVTGDYDVSGSPVIRDHEIEVGIDVGEFNEGIYNWTCYANDSSGNIAQAEEGNWTFIVDFYEPEIELLDCRNLTFNGLSEAEFNLSYETTDTMSPAIDCVFNLIGPSGFNLENPDALGILNPGVLNGFMQTSPNFYSNESFNGEYYWNVTCTDWASWNHTEECVFNITFYPDAPNVVLIEPEDDSHLDDNSSIEFKCNATDDVNVENVTLIVYDDYDNIIYSETSLSPDIAFGNGGQYSFVDRTNEYENCIDYHWNCNATDGFVYSTASDDFEFIVDLIAPEANLLSPISYSEVENFVSFDFEIKDECSLFNCSLFIDENLYTSENGSFYNSLGTSIPNLNNLEVSSFETFTYNLSQFLESGLHNWSLQCVDEVGNELNSSIEWFNVTVEQKAPEVRVMSPLRHVSNAVPDFHCNASDNTMTVQNITVHVPDEITITTPETHVLSPPQSYIDYSGWSGRLRTIQCHPYYWNCSAWDQPPGLEPALQGWSEQAEFIFDEIAPSVNLISPEDESIDLLSPIELNFSAQEDCTNVNITNCTLFINGALEEERVYNLNSIYESYNLDLASGEYNWSVECCDEANNCNLTEEWNFTVKDPSLFVELIDPDNYSAFKSIDDIDNFTCNVTSDLEIDSAKLLIINCSDDSIIYSNIQNIGALGVTEYTFTWDPTSLGLTLFDGDYLWNCRAFDEDGNVNSASSDWKFTIDSLKPDVSIDNPLDGDLIEINPLNYEFTANDDYECYNDLHLMDCNLSINSTPIYESSFFGISPGYSTSDGPYSLENGNYNLTVCCTDLAGNKGCNTSLFNVNVDNTCPKVGINSTPKRYLDNLACEFDLQCNASDSTDSLKNISIHVPSIITLNPLDATDISVDGFLYAESSWTATAADEGIYNWNCSAIDNPPDGASACESYSTENPELENTVFICDRTAPVVTLNQPLCGEEITLPSEDNIDFTYNVTDNLVNITNCEFKLFNTNTGSSSSIISNYNQEVVRDADVSISQFLGEGNYTWNVTCYDEAGNYNSSECNFTIIEGDAPSIVKDLPEPNDLSGFYPKTHFTQNPDVDLTCNVTCNVDLNNVSFYTNFTGSYGLYDSVESGFPSSPDNYQVINSSTLTFEGRYLWNCDACSEFGVCSTADSPGVEGNWSIVYDVTAPAINLLNPCSQFMTNDVFTMNFSVAETLSPFNCTVRVYNESRDLEQTEYFGWEYEGYHVLDFTSLSFANGNYSYNVTCQDVAGNVNNEECWFYVDSTKPSVWRKDPINETAPGDHIINTVAEHEVVNIPSDPDWIVIEKDQNANFTCNASDENLDQIKFYSEYTSALSIFSSDFFVSPTYAEQISTTAIMDDVGEYDWWCNATDLSGNEAKSTVDKFVVDTAPGVVESFSMVPIGEIEERRPNFNWDDVIDPDGDDVFYQLNISYVSGTGDGICTVTEIFEENLVSSEFIPTVDLCTTYNYTWKVRVCDEYQLCDEWSEEKEFKVQTTFGFDIDCGLIFDALKNGDDDNTSSWPLVDKCNISFTTNDDYNITINNTEPLWDGITIIGDARDDDYLSVNPDEDHHIMGSQVPTNWLKIHYPLPAQNLIKEITGDGYWIIDFKIKVPDDEPLGNKESEITFEGVRND